MSILENTAAFLGFDEETINSFAEKAPYTYKKYNVKKKNSDGFRTIYHPAKTTKIIQYALINIILRKIEIHPCATAYISSDKISFGPILRSPICRNAAGHAKYKYSIKCDFKDFFPSIKPIDFISILKKEPEYKNLSEADEEFIKRSLFAFSKKDSYFLAIGAPSSPIISNIVMKNIDIKLAEAAKRIAADSALSRYADDIVFSTDKKGGCNKFLYSLSKIVQNSKSPQLRLNEDKTVFMSKGTLRRITGIVVCPNGQISLGRKNKRYIKKLVHDFLIGNIDDKKKKYLAGWISYIIGTEPNFYNRLSIKYGASVIKEIRKFSQDEAVESAAIKLI